MATKKKTAAPKAKKSATKSTAVKASARTKGANITKVTAKSAKKTATRSTSAVASRNGHHAGVYVVPSGNVSIAVPAFWTLRQTNDDLEVEGPSGKTSVIITAFQRQKEFKALDAREYMQHFLETANSNGRLRAENGTRQRSTARFRDVDGDNWEVLFLTNGNTLLLATCNSSEPRTGKEARIGLSVLDSLKLKGSK